MDYQDIVENLGKVFVIGPGKIAGRVETHIGHGRWKVFDFQLDDYIRVCTKDIHGLWKGKMPKTPQPKKDTGKKPDPKPDATKKPVTLTDFPNPIQTPDKNWTTEQLQQFAVNANAEAEYHGHQTAIHIRRLGHCLLILKSRVKHGEWENRLAQLGISGSTASRAMRLYEATEESEKLLENLGIMEAYRKYGILTEPARKKAKTGKPKGKKQAEAKKKEEEKKDKENRNFPWFLDSVLVGFQVYRDAPLDKAAKQECLRKLAKIQKDCVDCRKRLEGKGDHA